jgi:hypothetical protein
MNWLQDLFPFLFGKIQALLPAKDLEPDRFDYHRNFRHKTGTHIQQFTNEMSRPLEVYIEMYCELYTLQPEDEMTIIYEQDPKMPGLGLSTRVHEDSLQIYLQEFETAIVLINGKRVQPE